MPITKSIAQTFSSLFDETTLVQFSAYDGSRAGNLKSSNTLKIKSVNALRYILSHPGELGLARAFVTSHVEIEGDLHQTLLELAIHVKKPVPIEALTKLAAACGFKSIIRPDIPIEEAPPRYRRGLLHSLGRDKDAIAHHYDVSNEFYERILGPTMVYSCAVFTSRDSTLEQAQIAKVDLICRKLDLKPGMKLLDIGCGWGTLVRHAAKEYGVTALGVTLSQKQATLATQRIEESGLSLQIQIRLQDYREVQEADFAAISSVGMSEHVGDSKLNGYFSHLRHRIREDGRLLNHCITRTNSQERAKTGAFIDRYIFPDGELTAPSRVVVALHDSGFELRHSENLREHYAKTLEKWCDNLLNNWESAISEVGLRRARIWLLYMSLSRIGFETNRIQIHQFLGVANHNNGYNSMPLRNPF